MMRFIHIKK